VTSQIDEVKLPFWPSTRSAAVSSGSAEAPEVISAIVATSAHNAKNPPAARGDESRFFMSELRLALTAHRRDPEEWADYLPIPQTRQLQVSFGAS
jgi:hypothetical protein